jgi:hypothetical protein
LRHPQALVAPEPLGFLVVDLPALSAGIVVGNHAIVLREIAANAGYAGIVSTGT